MSDLNEVKNLVDQIGKNLHDLRAKAEKEQEELGKVTAETQARQEEQAEAILKYKERLDALETKNNRPRVPDEVSAMSHTAQLERSDEILKEMVAKNRLLGPDDVKANYYSLSEVDRNTIDRAYFPLWRKAMAGHIGQDMYAGVTSEEKRFMREVKASLISDDTNAGFLLAPPEMVREILRNITEVSPVRALADVRTGSAHSMKQPRWMSGVTGSWIGETASRSETTGLAYGEIEVTAHEHYVQLHASRQMLADAAYNIEAQFQEEAREAFAVLEGTAFVSGSGSGQPEGITSSSLITTKSAATSGTIAADDIIDVTIGQIKEPYLAGASWLWNRANVSRVLQLKDGNQQYLWSPGLQAGKPNLLYGFPFMTATDLASTEAASSNVALFGNFRAGYQIYDRQGMELIRDPFNSKDTGLVEFDLYRRVGGRVKKGEALVLYQL